MPRGIKVCPVGVLVIMWVFIYWFIAVFTGLCIYIYILYFYKYIYLCFFKSLTLKAGVPGAEFSSQVHKIYILLQTDGTGICLLPN